MTSNNLQKSMCIQRYRVSDQGTVYWFTRPKLSSVWKNCQVFKYFAEEERQWSSLLWFVWRRFNHRRRFTAGFSWFLWTRRTNLYWYQHL